MGVLRGVDLNRPLVIGEWPSPVRTHAGGLRVADGVRCANAITWVKKLNADVGEVSIGDHQAASTVADGMPGIEGGHPPFNACIHLDATHAMRPIDKGQFAPAGDPGFVGDPLAWFALIKPPVVAAIAVDQPDAVGERAGVKE